MLVSCGDSGVVVQDEQLKGETRSAITVGATTLRFIEVDGMEYMVGNTCYEGSSSSPFIVNLTLDKKELDYSPL
jgi:hypothetical protein